MDLVSMETGLLHDVVEDTSVTVEQVRKEFGDDRFVDVSFADLQTDSVKTVAESYEKLGLEFTDAARAKVQEWADGHKPGQRGTHTYELADFGLTEGQVREAFTDYLATYDASA